MLKRTIVSLLAGAACACGGGATATSPTPTAATVTSIGAAGGSVASADGRARLEVPPGALSSDVPLALRATTSIPLDPAVIRTAAYEISPANVAFQSPARLSLTYAADLRPSGTTEDELRIHRLAGGQWVLDSAAPEINVGTDTAATTVAVTGTYGVRWPHPTGPCLQPEDRQFDFWLGEWTFNQTLPSVTVGANSITRDMTNCLIIENFNGGLGRSISLFSRLDNRWHQTYVDTQNNRLALAGVLEGARMVLYQSANARSQWERLDATQVRFWQEVTRDGVNWTVTLESRYVAR